MPARLRVTCGKTAASKECEQVTLNFFRFGFALKFGNQSIARSGRNDNVCACLLVIQSDSVKTPHRNSAKGYDAMERDRRAFAGAGTCPISHVGKERIPPEMKARPPQPARLFRGDKVQALPTLQLGRSIPRKRSSVFKN